MKRSIFIYIIYTIFISICLAKNATAETTEDDFKAIYKIISLNKELENLNYKIAFIANAPTISAEKVKTYANKYGIITNVYSINELEQIEEPIVILEDTLSIEDQEKVRANFYKKPTITISSNIDCVKNSRCMLGIKAGSVIKILVDEDIYKNTGLQFNQQFRFITKKV